MALGSKGGGFNAFGAGAAGAEVGLNGVLKERYLEVSEQSRRVPVGLALIVWGIVLLIRARRVRSAESSIAFTQR